MVNGTYTRASARPAGRRASRKRSGGGNRGGRLVVSSEFARLTVAPQFLTLKFQAASVEQGKEVDLIVKVNKAADFPGAGEDDAHRPAQQGRRPSR